MAISNTSILIKRSTSTSTPTSLKAGELAYSYPSNTIFIGTSDGTSVLKIGGQAYTSQIDAATSANVASTIVKRDANFGFFGALYGNANTATNLLNSQNFSISGGDISASSVGFNGTAGVTLNASLNNVPGLTAGTVGSSTSVPVISYGANGRILTVSSATISTSFTVSGNTGSGSQAGGGTLTIEGNGTGITTTITGSGGSETVLIATDTTVARTNTSGVGAQVFNTDLSIPTNNVSIGGTLSVSNLNVSGNLIQYNATSTLNVGDPIIYLAANNTGDVVDIGMVGHFIGVGHSGGVSKYQHTGFVRDYNDNKWKLFSNVSAEPTTTVDFTTDVFYDTIKIGGIDLSSGTLANVATANITNSTIGTLNLTNALTVPNGGTGATSFNNGSIVVGSGTGALSVLANTGTAGTYGSSSYVPVITTDAYGRVSSVANTQIAIGASQITSGVLGYTYGGTGSSSYSTGQLLIAGATGFLSLANSTFTPTGSGATNSTVTSLTVDAYGRLTAATYSSISGLTVSQGGTGASTFTSSGVLYGNGTGALQATALAGSADQTYSNQILTVTNAGVPVWSTTMDGGTF